MGIKDLWSILGSFCERKPLFELQGKTVAIDLSGWICESQNISEYQVQPRMYLRNLYFRTCCLLLLGVNPVFVLDGKAPTLKYKTIASRNALQFKGAKPKSDSDTRKCKDRSRFNYTLKQCEEMLQFMGIACVKGNGEAEALCAHLNEDGLVHGCITQDSDCFAYGAKVVYKNFSISQQGAHAASGGSIDVYDIEKLKLNNGIGRNKMIALALLCGSDYNDGVYGVGKDSVLKLFNQIKEEEILNYLKSWREKDAYYKILEENVNDKTICTNCGHLGRLQSHNKKGCKDCDKTNGCVDTNYKEKLQKLKNEISVRKKSLEDPNFPNQDVIDEFQKRKDNVNHLNLSWTKPNLIGFVDFCRDYLQWEEIYAFGKFLPILTRWQVLNCPKNGNMQGLLKPDYIKKARNPKGTPSYEIIWLDEQNLFKNLIPDEQLVNVDLTKLLSTIEPQSLVEKTYPELVQTFLASKEKPKKVSKRKKKETDKEQPKKSRKQPQKTKERNIDSYFKKALINNTLEKANKKTDLEFDLDLSSFGDENDSDLSDIIDDIVSRKPDYLKPHLDLIKKKELNDSFFFCDDNFDNDQEDMFEKTFNELCRKDSDESKSDIEEENDEINVTNKPIQQDKSDNDEDSFTITYIPLADRIKAKMNSANL
nr:flap endonuclease GEN isoform X1 [Onthophagus taurus]